MLKRVFIEVRIDEDIPTGTANYTQAIIEIPQWPTIDIVAEGVSSPSIIADKIEVILHDFATGRLQDDYSL